MPRALGPVEVSSMHKELSEPIALRQRLQEGLAPTLTFIKASAPEQFYRASVGDHSVGMG